MNKSLTVQKKNSKLGQIIEENQIQNTDDFETAFYAKANKSGNITKENLDDLLQQFKFKENDSCCTALVEVKPKNNIKQYISKNKLGANSFTYAGCEFFYFKTRKKIMFNGVEIDAEDIWFSGKVAAGNMGYSDTSQAIRYNVPEEYRTTFGEILDDPSFEELNPVHSTGLKKSKTSKGSKSLPLKGNEKDAIYISEPGLYSLIFSSNKPEAIAFRKFVFEEVLTSLRKNGNYSINNILNINFDTTGVKTCFKKPKIEDYNDYNVIYIGVVGLGPNGMICKVGRSDCRIFGRLGELKATFGPQFKLVAIAITDNNTIAEDKYKKLIKDKGIKFDLTVNGQNQTELFVPNAEFTFDDAVDTLYELADDNQSKVVNETKDNIYLLIELAREKRLKEEAIARQKEADRDTLLNQNNKIEVKENPKEQPKEEPKEQPIVQQNIYIIFLDKKTVESSAHTHTNVLYAEYVNWLQTYHPNIRVPSNVEFCKNIKKYKDIKKVRVDNKVSSGISNLELRK
jgi:prophage antirepressor-like protein